MKRLIKRFIDITTSTFAIVFFSIPMLIIALLVAIKMGTPVLFIQSRAGKDGKAFKIYKFRTMKDTKDKDGKLLPNESRRDEFGDLLRQTSLDELPQLFNILIGNVSLVGPRPLLLEYVNLYNEEQRRRLNVKPGLTGWAQVKGRNAISWKQKFIYDVWYVDNWTLSLDIKILFLTILKVFKTEGVNTNSNQMVKRFTGNESD